jgi:hypothetical protein
LTTTYLPTGRTQTQTNNQALTEVVQGNSIALSLPQGLGTITNLAVQRSGSDLIVSWPQQDGTLLPLKFVPGTSGDYNDAVAALQQILTSNEEASASAAAASSSASTSASAAAQAQGALDTAARNQMSAYNDLASAVATLRKDVARPGIAGQELQTEPADLKTTQNDAAKVKAEAANAQPADPTVCSPW